MGWDKDPMEGEFNAADKTPNVLVNGGPVLR